MTFTLLTGLNYQTNVWTHFIELGQGENRENAEGVQVIAVIKGLQLQQSWNNEE